MSFVDLMLQRMEEARRSFIDEMPLLYLKNPTPTRRTIARARLLEPKIVRYRKAARYRKKVSV